MSTLELKEIIKLRIDKIDDEQILSAINSILNSQQEPVIMLTNEQMDDILTSRNEIKNGLGIDNVDLDLEISKWLQEK